MSLWKVVEDLRELNEHELQEMAESLNCGVYHLRKFMKNYPLETERTLQKEE